jgi:hypothetical protein
VQPEVIAVGSKDLAANTPDLFAVKVVMEHNADRRAIARFASSFHILANAYLLYNPLDGAILAAAIGVIDNLFSC